MAMVKKKSETRPSMEVTTDAGVRFSHPGCYSTRCWRMITPASWNNLKDVSFRG